MSIYFQKFSVLFIRHGFCLCLCALRYQGFFNLAVASEGLAGLIKGRIWFVVKAVYVHL